MNVKINDMAVKRQEKEQSDWMVEFEKNVLKRSQAEKRKKLKEKEMKAESLFFMDQKQRKRSELQARLEQQRYEKEKLQ